MKPQMEVVKIQQAQMLCMSPGVSSLSNEEGFDLLDSPFDSSIDDV